MAYRFDFRVGRNGPFTGDCAEAQETRGCWPSTFQRGDFSSYLSRRIVPSINIPYVYSENNFWSFEWTHNLYGFATELLSVLQTPILPCTSWTCEDISLGSTTSCSTISSTAVPFCVDQSRFVVLWSIFRCPQGFGVSHHVAWSHPILVGIKLFIHCSQ